jgi:hypothetical protein
LSALREPSKGAADVGTGYILLFEGETEMKPLSRGTSGAHGMRNEIGFWVLGTWEKRNASSFVFLNGTKTVRSGVYYFGSVLT